MINQIKRCHFRFKNRERLRFYITAGEIVALYTPADFIFISYLSFACWSRKSLTCFDEPRCHSSSMYGDYSMSYIVSRARDSEVGIGRLLDEYSSQSCRSEPSLHRVVDEPIRDCSSARTMHQCSTGPWLRKTLICAPMSGSSGRRKSANG